MVCPPSTTDTASGASDVAKARRTVVLWLNLTTDCTPLSVLQQLHDAAVHAAAMETLEHDGHQQAQHTPAGDSATGSKTASRRQSRRMTRSLSSSRCERGEWRVFVC